MRQRAERRSAATQCTPLLSSSSQQLLATYRPPPVQTVGGGGVCVSSVAPGVALGLGLGGVSGGPFTFRLDVGLGKFNMVVPNERELLFVASFPLSFAFGTSLLMSTLTTLGPLDILDIHVSAPSTL
jgi:hypothetical protein